MRKSFILAASIIVLVAGSSFFFSTCDNKSSTGSCSNAIALGQTYSGTITSGDPLDSFGYYYHTYYFATTALVDYEFDLTAVDSIEVGISVLDNGVEYTVVYTSSSDWDIWWFDLSECAEIYVWAYSLDPDFISNGSQAGYSFTVTEY
jgi:hypothetical protein